MSTDTPLFNRYETAILKLVLSKKEISPRSALHNISIIESMALVQNTINNLERRGYISMQQGGMYSMTSRFSEMHKKALNTPTNIPSAFDKPAIKNAKTGSSNVNSSSAREKTNTVIAAQRAATEAKKKADAKAKADAAAKAKADAEAKAKADAEAKAEAEGKRQVTPSLTKEDCLKSALKFNSKTAWNLGARTPWAVAKKNGWYAECCAHMGKKAVNKAQQPDANPVHYEAIQNIKAMRDKLNSELQRPVIEHASVKTESLKEIASMMPDDISSVIHSICEDISQ